EEAGGRRIEPRVSEPVPPRNRPAATPAPVPEDEPEVKRVGSQGLRAGGQGRSKLGPPMANSWVLSLPCITRPALCHLVTTTASSSGTCSCRTLEWAVVRRPFVQ